jgi:hypothetical protein
MIDDCQANNGTKIILNFNGRKMGAMPLSPLTPFPLWFDLLLTLQIEKSKKKLASQTLKTSLRKIDDCQMT